MQKSPDPENRLPLRVGAARWTTPGIIRFTRYQSGETAIEILNHGGEQQLVATVALVPYGAPHPGEYGLWLKAWSENEGVPEVLVQAGIVTLTGRKHQSGYVEALHAELTEIGRAGLARDMEAERARQVALVHGKIDALIELNVFTSDRAQRLKEALTESVIEAYMDAGFGIREIIDMQNDLLK